MDCGFSGFPVFPELFFEISFFDNFSITVVLKMLKPKFEVAFSHSKQLSVIRSFLDFSGSFFFSE